MKLRTEFGVSFSVKYAREMGVDPRDCLTAALEVLGIKRLRLMSYWDEHEKTQGKYDFKELDWQIKLAEKHGASVSLCLGLRQPRWPESHWPQWALGQPDELWQPALLKFIAAVLNRYKLFKCIESYQLENEALLRSFGTNGNYDRNRLKREFALVKQLDPSRPVIMSTSDSGGIPIFGPKPDMYASTIYRYFFRRGKYRHSIRPAGTYFIRAQFIYFLKRRKMFIHELQAEPWGPVGTSKMPVEEHFISMNKQRVANAISYAKCTRMLPADLWGLEWWYWLKTEHNNTEIWDYMKTVFNEPA
ncbi:MAG: hypothetical protein M3Q14_00450 [bacterium]|nr:hypothetical protein [bacterium]